MKQMNKTDLPSSPTTPPLLLTPLTFSPCCHGAFVERLSLESWLEFEVNVDRLTWQQLARVLVSSVCLRLL